VGDPAIATRKAALRDSVLLARRELTDEERRAASRSAAERLVRLPEVWRAGVVALYVATPDEIDPSGVVPMLRERSIRTLFPRVRGERLDLAEANDPHALPGGFRGIREPTGPAIDASVVDVVVLPGIAFDLDGGRLGQGGGHFDRLLPELPEDTVRIGLAFSCQVVPRVPREDHDEVVDIVVTDHAVHRTGARREPKDA
jgi:5-formyltetrahydrofolate cyclo-ligase